MKYLIYELFSGVGFCNQLFSLETAIYLANTTNRRLILLIRNPLCHCGRSSWDYGKFLEFFSNDYLQYLPNGLEVYYASIPLDIESLISISDHIKFPNRFSQIGIVDKDLNTDANKTSIKNFLNFRQLYLNDLPNNESEYIYINQSNASRCFSNFYTSPKNYKLMSNICESLSYLHDSFSYIFNELLRHLLPEKYLAIHFRFGDIKHSKSIIDNNSRVFYQLLIEKLDSINIDKLPIVIMCDRDDADILVKLADKYELIFTTDIIDSIKNLDGIMNLREIFVDFKRYEVVLFLLEKLICKKADLFIGHDGSTVSHYINYCHFLDNKPYYYYLDKTIKYFDLNSDSIYNNSYSWVLNGNIGGNVGWRVFFSDNIYKNKMKLITLTNDGYMTLTDNLLESMRKIGIEHYLKIYCIGESCRNYFRDKYPSNEIELITFSNTNINNNDNLKNWIGYKASQNPDTEGKRLWASITSYKIYAIHNELVKGNDVIFTDGDIVFDQDPIQYLVDNIGDNDLLIQNDNQDIPSRAMCSGFFYMKSNEKTINITDFDTICKNIDSFSNDQQYLRRFEKQLKVAYLDLDLFPNGKYYRENIGNSQIRIKPYIIHFNYDVSEQKIKRMKMFGKWYIDESITIKRLISTCSSIILSNNSRQFPISLSIPEKLQVDLPLSQYIESKGIILRQGFITQVKQHEELLLTSIMNNINGINGINGINSVDTIKNILEIGFLAGHSAEFFLKLNTTCKVYSFDNGSFQSVDAGKKYIDELYPDRHILIKGNSIETIPKFIDINTNIVFDIILIDGSYEYKTILADIINCKRLASLDTLLIVNKVLSNENWIKSWNKDPTNVWNKLVDEKFVDKIENLDIDVGRASVVGKYVN